MSEKPEVSVEPSSPDSWRTYWKWEWFEYPAYIRHYDQYLNDLPDLTAAICKERGLQRVVDGSCGFGLTTVLLGKHELQVVGADTCDYCINVGLRLCKRLTEQVFDLQCIKPRDFGVIFGYEFYDGVMFSKLCDAITPEEMDASLSGCFDVLRPGGVLIWQGFAPDTDAVYATDQLYQDISKHRYHELLSSRFREEVKVRMTHILARAAGQDYLDEHHLYLIEQGDKPATLQSAILRRPYSWHGQVMTERLAAHGFTDFQTLERNLNGKTLRCNIAVRGKDKP